VNHKGDVSWGHKQVLVFHCGLFVAVLSSQFVEGISVIDNPIEINYHTYLE
jgi:hypothetical protein